MLKLNTLLFGTLIVISQHGFTEDPVIKKSKSGICHVIAGQYYARTKHFTAFKTMQDCIKSGGRAAKR